MHEEPEALRRRRILFVAGGVGTAPVYPQVKWLSERGVKADVIIGAKNKDTLILTDKMRAVAGEVFIATDDGSAGFHGMVTDLMRDLIDRQGKRYDEVIAIGPMIMMKFVARTTKEYGIRTIVSLNTLMVDGTGMCGACRVTVGGQHALYVRRGPGVRRPRGRFRRGHAPSGHVQDDREPQGPYGAGAGRGPRLPASDSIDDVKPAPVSRSLGRSISLTTK